MVLSSGASILCVILIIGCGLIGHSVGKKRSIGYSEINPGCELPDCNNNTVTVIHTIADGVNDSIHYIWDFTGPPSILIALTPLATRVTFNWTAFFNNDFPAIKFSKQPIYSASTVLTKVFVFNDAEDTGAFPVTNSSVINTFNTWNLTWVRGDFHKSVHGVEVTVVGDNAELFGEGNIKLKFKCFGDQNHDTEFPHLLHSVNVTQVDIEFVKIAVANVQKPRIAIEFVYVADEADHELGHKHGQRTFTISTRKTLDDEHTPGIFELIDIISPESLIASRGSYMQYRPVSYTHPERDVSTSTSVHISDPTNLNLNMVNSLNGSLAWSYYGSNVTQALAQGFNITLGLSEDGFYSRTNYTTWTFVFGYGTPPSEQLSMFVLIVACIGLGIPLALLVGGGCYICIKRVRNR